MKTCKKTEQFVMDKTQIDSIFRILNVIAKYEKQELKKETKSQLICGLYVAVVVVPFVAAVFFAVLKAKYSYSWANTWGLGSLFISYLGLFMLPFVSMWLNRKYLLQAFMHPLLTFISNAKITTTIDNRYIRYLMMKPEEQLRFVFLELNSEKETIDKRINVVIGAVDKVGLFPGILSSVILIFSINDPQPDWLYAIAYANPIIYFIGAYYHFELSRLSRLCSLIENVLRLKDKRRKP